MNRKSKDWRDHVNITQQAEAPEPVEPTPAPEGKKEIPAEALRRLRRGPVIVTVNPDGSKTYRHDKGIREGRIHS